MRIIADAACGFILRAFATAFAWVGATALARFEPGLRIAKSPCLRCSIKNESFTFIFSTLLPN